MPNCTDLASHGTVATTATTTDGDHHHHYHPSPSYHPHHHPHHALAGATAAMSPYYHHHHHHPLAHLPMDTLDMRHDRVLPVSGVWVCNPDASGSIPTIFRDAWDGSGDNYVTVGGDSGYIVQAWSQLKDDTLCVVRKSDKFGIAKKTEETAANGETTTTYSLVQNTELYPLELFPWPPSYQVVTRSDYTNIKPDGKKGWGFGLAPIRSGPGGMYPASLYASIYRPADLCMVVAPRRVHVPRKIRVVGTPDAGNCPVVVTGWNVQEETMTTHTHQQDSSGSGDATTTHTHVLTGEVASVESCVGKDVWLGALRPPYTIRIKGVPATATVGIDGVQIIEMVCA